MKKYLTTTIFVIPVILGLLLFSFYSDYSNDQRIEELLAAKKVRKEMKKRTAIQRSEWEFLRLRNPETNSIPKGIAAKEMEFAKKLPKRSESVLFKSGSAQNAEAITWQERGPNNLGGRTRAFAPDSRNSNIILAGSASGGIWRTTNGLSSNPTWTMVTTLSQLPSISCIVQDPTAMDTWYAGTGEGRNNSASGGDGSEYLGNGIYKSTDNGASWTLLSSTSANVYLWDNDFEFVNSLAISSNGTIFAAVNSSILRSTDDGATWTRVLGSANTLNRSEVVVNAAGDIYASISSNNTDKGIYKSTAANNGATGTWTNITPVSGTNATQNFPTNYPRVILATAPSDNNILYIYAYTPGAGQQKDANEGSSFWKYDASKSSTAQWVNRSANLPPTTANVGGMDTQRGYNMFLIVKPDDPNFVIIGATNLYRSTDAFATSASNTSTNWIGGYAVIDDISEYANHFPDQHSGFFQTGNTSIFYSGHDTGLSRTSNINADPVVWSNIDNGYNVAQFYTVELAPEALSTFVSGGLQDAGALFTTAGGLSNWTAWQGGGDGAFTAVAPVSDNLVYAGIQNGVITKLTRANGYISEITPTDAKNQLFINPFLLDHNNSNFLYYGGGNSTTTSGIWRNNDIKNSTATHGWSHISSIVSASKGNTSAIDVSYTNSANVVYYGTSAGYMFKITNANATPSTTEISSGLPDGYISGISIDPTNSNNVLIVFSNYGNGTTGFNSIYYTSDGGSNWTLVEGNLASTDGPSVRSCEIFQVDGVTHYFIGTSIGIYFTLNLNGASTVWTQEATSTIGNLVCDYLDWRSDAGTIAKVSNTNNVQVVSAVRLAVATHGRGVFEGTLESPLPVELTTFAGIYNGNSVELQWVTATEVNNYGFEIQRKSSSQSEWEMIGFISGAGNSNSPKNYSFADNSLVGGNKFYYRLKQIDIDGKFEYSSTVEISVVIDGYELSQNYPNPFNPSTKISYTIPENASVKVEIYSITGELISQLVNSKQSAGKYSIDFNSQNYKNLSSGMYIYRINAEGISGKNFAQTKKMLLLK